MYVFGALGLALLAVLLVRSDVGGIVQALRVAGWGLLWLVPYRALFFLLYALGWDVLLRPYSRPRGVGLPYLFWVASVREAVDRLLPVASVGGSVVGIRLLRWRGMPTIAASVSVILEIVLTLVALYAFIAVGLVLLFGSRTGAGSLDGINYAHLVLAFLCTLPVPVLTALLLRYGSLFSRLQRLLRPMFGDLVPASHAGTLDGELAAALSRGRNLFAAGALQWLAMISAAFEVWWVLRIAGHPVSAVDAIVIESMTQAARHVAFFVPGALGVQEAGLLLAGHALGVGAELALAVSMAKRLREILCGLPPLVSWQWLELRRLRGGDDRSA